MPAHFFGDGVGDVFEWIRRSRVLGDRLIIEVDESRHRVVDDILEDRPEHLRRRVDLRFCAGRQPDDLRVASSFEIEHPFIAPAVLVVSDQAPFRVGGKSGLAGSRQSEKDRRVSILPDVGGTVHRHDSLEREKIVEDGEDGFFDLARVRGVAYDAKFLRKVECDKGIRRRAVDLGNPFKRREDQHREIRHVPAILFVRLGKDEHVTCEHRMPRVLGDDPYRHPVVRVCAAVAILHKDILPLQESLHAVEEVVELVGAKGAVVLSPPDLIVGRWLFDDELVVRRTGGVLAGIGDDGTEMRDPRLASERDLLIQGFCGEIPVCHAEV